MSRSYWAKIVLGMLAIFVVGVVINRGLHRAGTFFSGLSDKVESSLPLLLSAGFKVDGDRIGDVKRLQFMRSHPGEYDSAIVSVQIDDSDDVNRISTCTLRVTNAAPYRNSTRFLCTSHRDSVRLDLVPFGHIEVLPEGKTVTFYVARNSESEMRQHAYRGAGSNDSGDVDINDADGNFSITVNGQQIVKANGDSNGGGLTIINPATGKPIVQIHGDSNGGSVKVNDANGKSVVNIHGTNGSKPSGH